MKKTGLLLLIVTMLFTSACRRSRQGTEVDYYGQGTGSCRIANATRYAGTDRLNTTSFFYDNDNQISRITVWDRNNPVGVTTTFSYADRVIIARHINGNLLGNYDSLILNNNGDIAQRFICNGTGWIIVEVRHIYNTSGQLATREYYQLGRLVNTENFKWENGDMTEYSSTAGATYRYTYTNIPAQFFSPAQQSDIITIGRPMWRNMHMESTFKASTVPGTVIYNYAFDATGKIVTDTLLNTGTSSRYHTTLDYECHNP